MHDLYTRIPDIFWQHFTHIKVFEESNTPTHGNYSGNFITAFYF